MPEPETIESVATDLKEQWVHQDTASTPPEPAPEPQPAPTPAPEPAPEQAPAAAGQPRGPDGKFITVVGDGKADDTAAVQAAADAAAAQAVEDFIEGRVGEDVFKIPKNLQVPLKRGNEVVYEPFEEVRQRGMFERDYRIKTSEASRLRREAEEAAAQLETDRARLKAREEWIAEQEAEMREAQKDPEKWEAYQEMQRLYQANPRFRQVMDDALAKRETDAVLEVHQGREYEQSVQEGVTLAAQWIEELAQDPAFAGVNPDRIRVLYAQALSGGTATLDPGEVRALYENEARYLTESRGPLQAQLAELKAQVEQLTAGRAADSHNAGTAHALQRAKAPPTAPHAAPPLPGTKLPQGKFGPRDLPERNQAWINARD